MKGNLNINLNIFEYSRVALFAAVVDERWWMVLDDDRISTDDEWLLNICYTRSDATPRKKGIYLVNQSNDHCSNTSLISLFDDGIWLFDEFI